MASYLLRRITRDLLEPFRDALASRNVMVVMELGVIVLYISFLAFGSYFQNFSVSSLSDILQQTTCKLERSVKRKLSRGIYLSNFYMVMKLFGTISLFSALLLLSLPFSELFSKNAEAVVLTFLGIVTIVFAVKKTSCVANLKCPFLVITKLALYFLMKLALHLLMTAAIALIFFKRWTIAVGLVGSAKIIQNVLYEEKLRPFQESPKDAAVEIPASEKKLAEKKHEEEISRRAIANSYINKSRYNIPNFLKFAEISMISSYEKRYRFELHNFTRLPESNDVNKAINEFFELFGNIQKTIDEILDPFEMIHDLMDCITELKWTISDFLCKIEAIKIAENGSKSTDDEERFEECNETDSLIEEFIHQILKICRTEIRDSTKEPKMRVREENLSECVKLINNFIQRLALINGVENRNSVDINKPVKDFKKEVTSLILQRYVEKLDDELLRELSAESEALNIRYVEIIDIKVSADVIVKEEIGNELPVAVGKKEIATEVAKTESLAEFIKNERMKEAEIMQSSHSFAVNNHYTNLPRSECKTIKSSKETTSLDGNPESEAQSKKFLSNVDEAVNNIDLCFIYSLPKNS